MYTGYYIQEGYIYGPTKSGRYYIQGDYVYGPGSNGRYYLSGNYFYGPGSQGRFYVEGGYIYGRHAICHGCLAKTEKASQLTRHPWHQSGLWIVRASW